MYHNKQFSLPLPASLREAFHALSNLLIGVPSIRERTIEKYGIDNSDSGALDLMSISKPIICVWNILRYSLRMWNGKGKDHDLEKIAHYAQLAWGMSGDGNVSKE